MVTRSFIYLLMDVEGVVSVPVSVISLLALVKMLNIVNQESKFIAFILKPNNSSNKIRSDASTHTNVTVKFETYQRQLLFEYL